MSPQQRNTANTVALILAVVVAVVVLLTTVGLLWLQITRPGTDTAYAAEQISRIVGVLVAALVGSMAGRRYSNGNGH